MNDIFCRRGHDTRLEGRTKYNACRVCTRINDKNRNKNPKRIAAMRERQRRWKAENREWELNYKREWRSRNKERDRAYGRAHYARNKVRMLASNRLWQEQHPERVREYNRAYAAQRRPLPKEVLDAVFDYYGKNCVYCGVPATGLDHLHPLAQGGAHSFENLAPCCKSCNSRKRTRPIWAMLEPKNQRPVSRPSEPILTE